MVNWETGRVVSVKNGSAFVQIKRDSSCKACNHCKEEANGSEVTLQVPLSTYPEIEEHSIHTGDVVKFECESAGEVKLGFLYLMLPIILAIVAYAAGAPLLERAGVSGFRLWAGLLAGFLFVLPILIQLVVRKRWERAGNQWIRIVDVEGPGAFHDIYPSCCS